MCDYIAHRKDIQQDVEVLASPCNEWIILVRVVQKVDHSHSPLENSVSSGSTYPVNRYLSTGYHHILAKSLSIGPHPAAAILDSKRGWKGMKIAKVEDLSFFNFPGVEQKRKRTPALEAIICFEDILY